MLLEARFGPLRFLLGCRVGAITDETITVDGRAVRVWGWSYGTLEGHVERGQDGLRGLEVARRRSVEFRIHAVSRRARAGNPVVRLGLRLVGRREQVRFARRACERMAELVESELWRSKWSAVTRRLSGLRLVGEGEFTAMPSRTDDPPPTEPTVRDRRIDDSPGADETTARARAPAAVRAGAEDSGDDHAAAGR